MRFEIKHTKMPKLNKLGVKTFFDLQNLDFEILKTPLLKEWENVLYYENPIHFNRLSKIKEKQINNYSNPKYWETLKGKNFTYHLGEYNKIVINHIKQTQNEISQIIKNKVDELNTNPIHFNRLDIVLNRIVSKTQNCIVTGLDISMQKEGSFLLSHTGLKYYLSVKWSNANTETQIKEIAHNIRNKVSNTRVKQTRLYQTNQTNILDILN